MQDQATAADHLLGAANWAQKLLLRIVAIVKNLLLVATLIGLGFWWFRTDSSNTTASAASTAAKTEQDTRTTAAKSAPRPQAATAPAIDDTQRRQALQQESLRLSEERERKQVEYRAALVAYDTKRRELTEQMEALGRSNKNGRNTSKIDELLQKRTRLPMPPLP